MSTPSAVPAGEAVAISEFKARCLALVEQVRQTGRPLVITRHGKPVAEVVPVAAQRAESSWLGEARGTLAIAGDVVSPAASPEEWEALRP